MIEFKIFSIYEDELNKRLEKANRKAAKNGLAEMSVEITRYRDNDGKLISIVAMDDFLPTLRGWSLVAALDFIGGEMLTRTLPGKSLPANFTNDPTRCDHCGVRHERRYAMVIQHENGDVMQVGKSCMDDFLGKNAESLIGLEWLVDFVEEYTDKAPDGKTESLDLEYYLRFVQLAIRAYGWASKSSVPNNPWDATANIANILIDDKIALAEAKEAAANNPRNAPAYKISDALKWASEQSGNDYLDNISAIARLEIVPKKYEGYAASILAGYERHLAQEIERKLMAETATPATSGRQTVAGTILSIKEKYSDYGMQIKVLVKINDGWKLYCTLPKAIINAEVGDQIEMSVTVKKSYKDDYFAFGSRPAKAKIV